MLNRNRIEEEFLVMQVPVQVAFRGMQVSDAVEAACHKEAEKLERFFNGITSCRIVVTQSHHRHNKGNLYEIRVDVTVPRKEIVVNREPADHHTDEDVYVAVREAFDTTRRQLESHARKLHGKVKTHEPPPHGRVARLLAEEGYGFIETPDGRELYFHRNSVLDGHFDKLVIGDEVRFAEEDGEKGPQASTVRVVGRHNHLS
jgi:ribosomal subunit interface protein